MLQIRHVIEATEKLRTETHRHEIEWQTRALATYLGHLAANPKAAEQLIDAAQRLSMTDPDDMPDRPADTSAEDTRTLEDIMENGNVEAALRRNNQRKGPGLPWSN